MKPTYFKAPHELDTSCRDIVSENGQGLNKAGTRCVWCGTLSLLKSKSLLTQPSYSLLTKQQLSFSPPFPGHQHFQAFNSQRENTSKDLAGQWDAAFTHRCLHLCLDELARLCWEGTQLDEWRSHCSACFLSQILRLSPPLPPSASQEHCSCLLLEGENKHPPSLHSLNTLIQGRERSCCLIQRCEPIQLFLRVCCSLFSCFLFWFGFLLVCFFVCSFVFLMHQCSGHVYLQLMLSCFGDHTGNWLQVGLNKE